MSAHPEVIAIQQKFSFPVACLVFALIGLALGLTVAREGKLASFVIGVLVIFAYYIVMFLSESLTKGHYLNMYLTRWMPNILLGRSAWRRSSGGRGSSTAACRPPDLRNVDTQDPDYLQEALVPMSAESHGGDDVGIWARGPGSDAVRGSVEQNAIFHFMLQAMPRLRDGLCKAGDCDGNGVPVKLPDPAKFR